MKKSLKRINSYIKFKELIAERLQVRGKSSALFIEKEVICRYEGFKNSPCISNDIRN